jgi:hypothetical protein
MAQYLQTGLGYGPLAADGPVRERRDQLTHPAYQRPELLAEEPNEVYSWDITKLKGPAKWTYYSWIHRLTRPVPSEAEA